MDLGLLQVRSVWRHGEQLARLLVILVRTDESFATNNLTCKNLNLIIGS